MRLTNTAVTPRVGRNEILNYAREVFGNPQKAFSWLTTPNALLGGMTPKNLLEMGDADDLASVYNELSRIDQGVF